MTLRQLEYFVAVCEHQSFSAASKQLFVTQPTISTAISALEKEYNIKLFTRGTNYIALTDEGEFLYERALSILKNVDNLNNDLEDLSNNKSTIRIGIPPMIGSFLFPQIYKDYRLLKPNINFSMIEEGSLSIRNKIINEDLDLGIVISNNYTDYYNVLDLLETELVFAVSKNSPLAQKEVLDINDISDYNIMMMREGSYQNMLISNLFNKIDKKPNITLISGQITVIRQFIKMDSGGAFLIKELLDKNDDSIVGIPFKDNLSIKIGLIWGKDKILHNEAINFIEYLADKWSHK